MAGDIFAGRAVQSLIQGVSEQPPHIRAPGHLDAQENCRSVASDGVTRRPPFEYVSTLISETMPQGGYFTHIYDRDGEEQYVVIIDNGQIRVRTLDGTTCGVTDTSTTYLDFTAATYAARDVFRAVTVADTTFVLNRNVTPAMSGVTTTARPFEFLYVAKQHSNLGTNTLKFDSTAVEWSSATVPSTSIDNLYTALTGAGLTGSWTFTKLNAGASGKAGILHGIQTSGAAYTTMTYADHDGDSGSGNLIFRKVQKFSDLPSRGADGFIAEIVGADGDIEDNYWVKYDEDEGAWIETVKPELDNTLDSATLPHVLVRTGVNTFTFGPVTWDTREKGDEFSAPEPHFIGQTIRDITYHKGRLCFLSGEEVDTSEKDRYQNFWPTTATAVIDSDPLRLSASSNRVTYLDWAVPYNRGLTIFSARGGVIQEVVSDQDGVLSPKAATVAERAAYANSPYSPPRAIGQSVYFVQDRDTASSVYEYRVVSGDVAQAEEITSHLPRYMLGRIRISAASSNENLYVLSPEGDPNTVYVYGFLYSGSEKVMSSWSRWSLSQASTILGLEFIDSKLYAVVYRADGPGLFLHKCDLRKLQDGDMGFRVHLDSLHSTTGSYDGPTDTTTWTLPFGVDSDETWKVILTDQGWDDRRGKTLATTTYPGSPLVTATGDWTAHGVHLGHEYLSSLTFSAAIVEQQQNVANASLARLQLKQYHIAFTRTGYFKTKVTYREQDSLDLLDTSRIEYTKEHTGRMLGSYTAVVGPPIVTDGTIIVGAAGDARNVRVTVESQAYLPFTISSSEWEGTYAQRTRQV